MTEDEIERRIEKLENLTGELSGRVTSIEKRVDAVEGKLDSLLDSTAELKNMLRQNTGYSRSAKNNATGWGIVGFISSLVMSIARLLI